MTPRAKAAHPSSDSSHFVGRETELATLAEAFETTTQGRGGVVLLAGEAGVGKTRLAWTALDQSGLTVFSGRAWEQATPAHGPLIGALRSVERHTSRTPAQVNRTLDLLLKGADEIDAEGLAQTFIATLESLTRKGPIAVFLEDIHWADNATIEILLRLAMEIDDLPLLIIATYRSDEIRRGHPLRRLRNDLRRAQRLTEITLPHLSEEESTALIAHTLGKAPSPSLAALIHERTQGVALFVEELATALEEGGHLHRESDGLALIPGEDVPIPESVRDAVVLRLDGLPENVRDHLETAAVAGTEFSLSMLATLTGDERGVEELMERGFIVEDQPGRGTFHHALMREAIYREIGWSRRRRLHREIAAHLENTDEAPLLIGEHWLAANEHNAARRAFLRSAERACRVQAYRDAVSVANRALKIWPEGEEEPERLATLERLAHCAQICGHLRDAVRALRELIASPTLATEHCRRGEALRSLATIHGLRGEWDQSINCQRESAEAFLACDKHSEAATSLLAAAGRMTGTLQLDAAVETALQAEKVAHRAGRRDLEARSLGLRGNILAMQGHFTEGRKTVQRGLAIALEDNITDAASEVFRRLASALEYASDYAGAKEAYSSALNFCREQGADAQAQVCMGCMTYVLFQTGDWKPALETCREVMNMESAPPGSRSVAEGVTGLIRTFRGEVRPGRKYLRLSYAAGKKHEIAAMELLSLWGLATVEEQDNNEAAAEDYHLSLLTRWEQTQDMHDVIPALCTAAVFFAARGGETELTKCTEALATIASETGNPEALAGLARALGETALMNDDVQEACHQYRQALKHLENLEIPLDRAMTEHRAGFIFTRANQREEAIRHLTNGYRIARKLGARPLAAQIAAELEALGERIEEGAHPEQEKKANRGGLTRRQLEILRLIAEGLTNKEVASRLHISTRTVDMHARHLFERLDCRSRTEAIKKATELDLLNP